MGCETIVDVFEGISGADKVSKVNYCVKITHLIWRFQNLYLTLRKINALEYE